MIIESFAGALLVIIPLWVIFRRAGLAPALSLIVFLPYLGFVIVVLILAFARWPATEGADPRWS